MAHAARTIIVHRPVTEVFEFLADGLNNPTWRPDVTTITLRSGHGVGAVYEQTMKGPGGREIRGDYRITKFNRPTRLDFDAIADPARPTGSFTLEPVGSASTQLTFTLDLKPRGLMMLMAPMINRQVRAEVASIDRVPQAMAN